jgi:hypothetical protein
MSYLTIKIGAWFITGLAAFTLLWDASKPAERQPEMHGQITTVLNSVVPPTVVMSTIALTPLPTAIPKGCAQYVADAITLGWPAIEAPTLARVMFRESRCNPLVLNSKDSNKGSRGLMQVNGVHYKWMIKDGLITKLDDLYNPNTNLTVALHLWRKVGWSAWALPNP